jgi:hypothetical protein
MKKNSRNINLIESYRQATMYFCLPIFYHGKMIILNHKFVKQKMKKYLQLQYFFKKGA